MDGWMEEEREVEIQEAGREGAGRVWMGDGIAAARDLVWAEISSRETPGLQTEWMGKAGAEPGVVLLHL